MMKISDEPLGYAEFHLHDGDGQTALTKKAYTYADLHNIIDRLPVGLVFEVQLYANGVQVGSGTYRRHNPHIECEQERGACVNLLQGEFNANSSSKTTLA